MRRLLTPVVLMACCVVSSPGEAQIKFLPSEVKLAKALALDDPSQSPATFSWTQKGDKSTNQLDAALYYQFDVPPLGDFVGLVGVSAAVGSARDEDARVVQPMVGLHGPVGDFYLVTTSTYEMTSSGSTQKAVLSPMITLTRIPQLGWGEELVTPTPNDVVPAGSSDTLRFNAFRFRWRPYIGADLGQVRKAEDTFDGSPKDTFTRGVLRLDASLRWVLDERTSNNERPRAIYDRVALTGTYWGRHLFASEDWQPYWNTSLTFYPAPHLKLGVTFSYSEGSKPPTFARETVYSIGLAVEQ